MVAVPLKMNAAMTYRNEDAGYHGGLRFRVQNGFKANSGVYVGNVDGFGVLDNALTRHSVDTVLRVVA